MKRIVLMALVLGLAGCQATSFETAPLTATACDPALTGRWLSIDDEGKADGEVEIRVSDDCQLEVDDREKGVARQGPATALFVAEHVGEHFAWVDAAWVRARFAPEVAITDGDIYLMHWRVKSDDLWLRAPDHVAIAHKIIDGDIPGEVHSAEHRLRNRITGPAAPKLLEANDFFDRDELRFRRSKDGAP